MIKQGNKKNKTGEPRKTLDELKKERYIKFLEEEDNNIEIAEKERIKALDCMMKAMNHHLEVIRNETKDMSVK